ncbi:DUF2635 domain-containing protein [Salmonella enterica]|uniref:DUF2635 domain-containing protein n=1 Tax=Salmonella enterica TaxID=28901 RepID=UPI0009AF129B|nr:DUF2635 domain-containing protein [Salmonella enterica]EAM4436536.1 DUF2635 domain-containing protein [Salmonella enterica subsp. enterica serovar Give]EAU5127753.1 DUF2635 domain-containing protein [Salmonella enterica subsp. enterica serovar Infantis]EBH8584259.1 DUF2635 domain-containing protein [Salmonella enterica subsp. enterica serovar Pomona]ECC3903271.1 DUF2635 domain-containing protein [Salmonella enterica subsp. enterica]ECY3797157.1 DUF2635 domain-containing protein [Salmonella 
MKVRLTPGRAVRDPVSGMLLPENSPVEVPDNTFWRRRLRDGDVVLIPESQGGKQ